MLTLLLIIRIVVKGTALIIKGVAICLTLIFALIGFAASLIALYFILPQNNNCLTSTIGTINSNSGEYELHFSVEYPNCSELAHILIS